MSQTSGDLQQLNEFKKPEGSSDCAVCLVQNTTDAMKCAACESLKPGTNSACEGRSWYTVSLLAIFLVTCLQKALGLKLEIPVN